MIKLLLEMGIEYEVRDQEGYSALDLAHSNAKKKGGDHILQVIMWYKKRDERNAKALEQKEEPIEVFRLDETSSNKGSQIERRHTVAYSQKLKI